MHSTYQFYYQELILDKPGQLAYFWKRAKQIRDIA